ncbi:hypothetical protein [Bradyrhizobium sp. HKCCYLS20291]|uniref:hypothetical protein n=1 Tax=Bradyrhizobium sp. HKCCYLS20291 TaxID=3420766 RepID=UPI003EB9E00B
MKRAFFEIVFRLVAVALFQATVCIQLAAGQTYPNQYIPATDAADYARYYAPYAIQAGAAYIDVPTLNLMPAPSLHQEYVVQFVAGDSAGLTPQQINDREDFVVRARKYMRSWRYQFGSQGYITCLYDDHDCLETIKRDDRWTYGIDGGPSFHVWARFPEKGGAACSEVSIAFRGTIFTSYADWVANAAPRWLRADDHYRQLRRNIGAIVNHARELPCYKVGSRKRQIVTVGHSLGGGLAQFAGLADKRINKVFAFDPSPVTGAKLLDKTLREQNASRLEIDRVYQSKEVLAWVRPFYQQFPPATSPCVRTVPFDVSQPIGVIGLHSMNGLARGIVRASYTLAGKQRDFAVPGPTGCPRSYEPPATDEDDYDVPMLSSRGTRTGQASRLPTAVAHVGRRGLDFVPLRSVDADWSAGPMQASVTAEDTRRKPMDRHQFRAAMASDAASASFSARHYASTP